MTKHFRHFFALVFLLPSLSTGQEIQQATYTSNQAENGLTLYEQSYTISYYPDSLGTACLPNQLIR
jgi:hypothetical protein